MSLILSRLSSAISSTRGLGLGLPDWLVLLLSLLVVACTSHFFHTYQSRSSKHSDWVPVIGGGVPLLGNAIEYSMSTMDFIQKYKKIHGRAFQAKLAFKNVVFLDGTFAKAFFAQPESTLSFNEAMRQMLVPDLTIGAHVIESPWHMPILRVALHPTKVAQNFSVNMEPLFHKVSAKYFPPSGPVTLSAPSLLCWDIVARFSCASFFGSHLQDNEELLSVFVNLHLACFKVINTAAVMPKAFAFLAALDIKRHKRTITRLVAAEVRRRRSAVNAAEEPQLDLLAELMKGKDKARPDEELPAAVVADYMISLIFASMSTTAGVLTNVFMDLAGRPEHQPSLRAETRAAVAACGGKIDETFLGRVPKLSAFIRESVRLASLPIQGVRWSMKEVVLDGVRIPKNTVVTNCGILAHFDEDVFPGASSFDPSRFIDEDTGEECLPKGFLPFGTGRHVCPGRHFATAEIKVAVTLLLSEFEFKTVSGKVPAWKFLPTEVLREDEDVVFERVR